MYGTILVVDFLQIQRYDRAKGNLEGNLGRNPRCFYRFELATSTNFGSRNRELAKGAARKVRGERTVDLCYFGHLESRGK